MPRAKKKPEELPSLPSPEKKIGRPKLSEEQKVQGRIERQWAAFFEPLSESAPPSVEMNWIRNHPAMGRKDRLPPDKRLYGVTLEPADIKDAPSKAAVIALTHWVNNPGDFQKQVLSEAKKAATGGDDPDDLTKIPEIADIDKMLLGLNCAIDPESVHAEHLQ